MKALGFTHVLKMGMLVIARWEEDITIETASKIGSAQAELKLASNSRSGK